MKGKFIVLEGIDGSGTTTQVKRLGCLLGETIKDVMVTAEPTRGPIGSLIRHEYLSRPTLPDPAMMTHLFLADRWDHWLTTIKPALDAGVTVLCDRYEWSTLAYQGATLMTQNPWDAEGALWWTMSASSPTPPAPDLVVLLDVPEQVALVRKRAVGGGNDVYEKPKFLGDVRQLYKFLHEQPDFGGVDRFVRSRIVDASLPMEDVTRECMQVVRELIGET